MTAPETMNGKQKVFEETFESPFEKDTENDALEVLNKIRRTFSELYGYYEVKGFAEHLPNGKWRAVRHHAKYE